jgi:hypothetical protein
VRILLDAKDLINIVEKSRPMNVEDFGQWLKGRNSTVVLSFTNVSDFVGPAFANNSFLEKRVLLQQLETLPLAYIREGTIKRDEFAAAVLAFTQGHEPAAIDPYVSRWDETAFWQREAATSVLVGQRLDDFVFMARQVIQVYKTQNAGIRDYIEEERAIPKKERWTLKQIFSRRMPDRLAAYHINSFGCDPVQFGEWLWDNPIRCLGARLFFEAHHFQMNDHSLKFGDGDVADFAHIPALPYVDALTVDKRIENLLQMVFRKYRTTSWAPDMAAMVYRDIDAVLKKFG